MNSHISQQTNSSQPIRENIPNQLSFSPQPPHYFTIMAVDAPSDLSFTLPCTDPMPFNELFSEIEDKRTKIALLTRTNIKQQKALKMLIQQLEDIESGNSLQIAHSKEEELHLTKENQLSLETEKILSSAMSQINMLSKRNNLIKKDSGLFDDYQYKLEVLDQNKMKMAQIDNLTNEVKYLSKEVEEHKDCLSQREILSAKLKVLKEEIRKSKQTYQSLRQKQCEVEGKYHKATSSYSDKFQGLKQLLLDSSSKRSANSSGLSYKSKAATKTFPYPNALISNEERQLIQEKMSNEKEFTELMAKIAQIEIMKTTLESQQNYEVRECKAKITSTLEELDQFTSKNKKVESKNRILLNTLNELKIEEKGLQKKLKDIQFQFDASASVLKEKNQELFQLTHQLASLKKLTQQDTSSSSASESREINNFINNINKQDAYCQFDGKITEGD